MPRALALTQMAMEDEFDRVIEEGLLGVQVGEWIATMWAIWRLEGDEASRLIANDLRSQSKAFADLGLLWSRAVGLITRRAMSVYSTTRDMLAGMTEDQMRDQYDDWLGWRVPFIAENEVLAAYGWTAFHTAEQFSPREREWNTMHDDRVRDTHADVDGQLRRMGEPFNVGGASLMHPGDPGGPASEVVNCRCWERYIL